MSHLPEDKSGLFYWGVATSSHQIEGHNNHNDWWQFEAEGNVEGGVRSGAAVDHWNRWPEDLQLAADLGINSYRLSIEWSRIEPEEGQFNVEALLWYKNLIERCDELGLRPMVTLHHFTLPLWLARKGGFSNDESVDHFLRYVHKVIKTLGARVRLWCTINEPMVLVVGSYLGKFMPPAVFAPRQASRACRNLLRAHVATYDLLHAELGGKHPGAGSWSQEPLQVGFAHNMINFRPDRRWHPIENYLSARVWGFYNKAWLDAVTGHKQKFGVFGLIPQPAQVAEALGRVTTDFIGVNYYTKAYLQWRPRTPMSEESFQVPFPLGLAFARRREPASDLGWAINPRGLLRILRFVGRYKLPVIITENGIADKSDRARPAYLSAHLHSVAAARAEGVDVRGYYHWSLIDNFEWIKGYKPRFGLVTVDYSTQRRTPTKSYQLYRSIIEKHGGRAPLASVLEGF